MSRLQRRQACLILMSLLLVLPLGIPQAALATQGSAASLQVGPAAVFPGPTNSSPIALSNGGGFVWVVNPDDDSVSILRADDNNESEVGKVYVGNEPQSIALDPDNEFAYVANAADNSVSIIHISSLSPFNATVERHVTTGAEPFNIVISPDGKRVFVANSAQDTITVIKADVNFPTLPSTIGNFDLRASACNVGDPNRHFQPRGLAVTSNNSYLFVTRFLSFTKTGGQQGTDDGKEGVVCRFNVNTDGANAGAVLSGATAIKLGAQDTGFAADIGPVGATVPTPTKAYPNQMQSAVICGAGGNERLYLPNIASSPAGPLKFNVDTQAFVNMVSSPEGAAADAGAINLHLGARKPELGKTKLFFANPWAIACDNPASPTKAYVASAGSDLLVKVNVQVGGALANTVDGNTTRYIDLNPNNPAETATFGRNAGKNPLGIVIRDVGFGQKKAFVMNFVSRNVSIVNIDTDAVIKVVNFTGTHGLPPAGSKAEQILAGAEIFFSSRGHFDRPAGTTVSTDNRLSSEGWQNCASCHFNGLTDANVWIFGSGPRKSVPLNSTWSPHNKDDQRILNYSAIFDEVDDFEANIRNVSGPGNKATPPPPAPPVLDENHGLITGATINDAPAAVPAFLPIANAGRPQHTLTLPGSNTAWPALEAMREWVRFNVRTPNGALTKAELTANGPAGSLRFGNTDNTGGLDGQKVAQGRNLFFQQGCAECHGGTKWTTSTKDFTSPPAATEVFTEVAGPNPPPNGSPAPIAPGDPIGTQYLNRFLSDIGSFNLNVRGKGNLLPGFNDTNAIGAFERASTNGVLGGPNDAGKEGLGKDFNGDGAGKGFNIPSLLGIWSLQPYYHNGACETLNCVLANQTHRTGKGKFADKLANPADQAKVVEFLKSLDDQTVFPTDLKIAASDIFTNPNAVFDTNATGGANVVEIGANVQLFGTRSDLAFLAAGQIKVKFEADGQAPVEVNLNVADFNEDFGFATVKTNWTVPSNGGDLFKFRKVKVTVDSTDVVPEPAGNNTKTKIVVVLNRPNDSTPPKILSVAISDDNPFNDNDPITTTRGVKLKLKIENTPGPGGQEVTDLDKFCISPYVFSSAQQRFIPAASCSPNQFKPLPAPQGDGSFIADVTLPVDVTAGAVYAKVFVKDKAGNISESAQDVISYVPTTPITLADNELKVFRISLQAGQSFKFTFTPSVGALTIRVRDGVAPNAPLVDLKSAIAPNAVDTTIAAGGTARTFQIEVEGEGATNTFTISFAPVAAVAAADTVSPAGPTEPPLDLNDPTRNPTGSPPPPNVAVEDIVITPSHLPVISKP